MGRNKHEVNENNDRRGSKKKRVMEKRDKGAKPSLET
jgi:hypothetical protein